MNTVSRLTIVLLLAVLLTLTLTPVSAQEDRAAEPRTIAVLSDSFNNGSPVVIAIPDVGDAIDVSSFTVEAGEAAASCTTVVGTHSAWFKLIHPGGTLVIDTAYSTGSAYDTQIQLFASDTNVIPDLLEIGCDNDSGGGSGGNDARLQMNNLPSSVYYVRISCIALCGGTTDLALLVTYTPSGPGPSNDAVSSPTPLEFNSATFTYDIQYATEAGSENSVLGCAMYNTVWYRFIVPYSGYYSFNTFGSYLKRDTDSSSIDTKLAVYTSSGGPIFANFTEQACNDDFGGLYSALPSILFTQGDEVYVRIGTFSSQNLLAGSFYRLKASIVSISGLLASPGFEGALAPWTMKITGGIDGITNAYAQSGSYSARMSGEPGKTNKLMQKWNPADHGIKVAKKSTARAFFYYSTNNTTSNNAKAVLKIKYTDGTPASKASVNLSRRTSASSWVFNYLVAPVTKSKVAHISLIIKNKSTAGLVFVDSASLSIYGDPTRERGAKSDALLPVPSEGRSPAPDGLLPPPAAPDGFRGGS